MVSAGSHADIRVLQHHDDTPAELLGEWLDERGLAWTAVRPDHGDPIPADPTGWRGLVILGAEHSVNDSDPAWIADEIELTRAALDTGVPVLGICFGGQMLARVVGAEVAPAPGGPSIGWRAAESDPASPAAGEWLHYNYETFALPPGTESLAELDGRCAAFRLGPHLGLQFHPEATPEIVHAWAALERDRLHELGLDSRELIDASEASRADARQRAFGLFDAWLDSR
jgi:GMP synthase-like glutamine amidotransferase